MGCSSSVVQAHDHRKGETPLTKAVDKTPMPRSSSFSADVPSEFCSETGSCDSSSSSRKVPPSALPRLCLSTRKDDLRKDLFGARESREAPADASSLRTSCEVSEESERSFQTPFQTPCRVTTEETEAPRVVKRRRSPEEIASRSPEGRKETKASCAFEVTPRFGHDALMNSKLQLKNSDGEPYVHQSAKRARSMSKVRCLAGGAGLTSPSREEAIMLGKRLLAERLECLQMDMREMDDDGNCQFRALSYELFGTQDRHKEVRQLATRHMEKSPDLYQVFFEEEHEFKTYLEGMTKNGVWGDELTLRAVADAIGVKIHVVTSQDENWYLQYEPASPSMRELYLAYISPIHYNTLEPSMC